MERDDPLEVIKLVAPSVAFGSIKAAAFTGVLGGAVGGAASLFRPAPSALFAAASAIQCSTLGATFWATKQVVTVTRAYRGDQAVQDLSPFDRKVASGIAGGVSGAANAALFRGRGNIVPAMLICSPICYVGQSLYEYLDSRQHEQARSSSPSESWLARIGRSKWSPMKLLSDEEYENMLLERLIRVEAEIAIVDENISRLEQQRQRGISEQSKR